MITETKIDFERKPCTIESRYDVETKTWTIEVKGLGLEQDDAHFKYISPAVRLIDEIWMKENYGWNAWENLERKRLEKGR